MLPALSEKERAFSMEYDSPTEIPGKVACLKLFLDLTTKTI
jgi:hypothetical protein